MRETTPLRLCYKGLISKMSPESGPPRRALPWSPTCVHVSSLSSFTVSLVILAALVVLFCSELKAQNLTLEGQTGGFLTPTAYVVYAEKGQFFSHPAVGFHFIDASKVIGNIETLSVTESFASRAEVGYTRSIHQFGDSGSGTTVLANAVLGLHRRPPQCQSRRILASSGTSTA